jgi:hypothetical protein
MKLGQHGLAGELNLAVIRKELTNKLPAMELELWLLEKPHQADCATKSYSCLWIRGKQLMSRL